MRYDNSQKGETSSRMGCGILLLLVLVIWIYLAYTEFVQEHPKKEIQDVEVQSPEVNYSRDGIQSAEMSPKNDI